LPLAIVPLAMASPDATAIIAIRAIWALRTAISEDPHTDAQTVSGKPPALLPDTVFFVAARLRNSS
jgi:hypothetical protein